MIERSGAGGNMGSPTERCLAVVGGRDATSFVIGAVGGISLRGRRSGPVAARLELLASAPLLDAAQELLYGDRVLLDDAASAWNAMYGPFQSLAMS
ncbi:hypothetical protein MRX96_008217 [Rhipicephalus microplus]